MRIDSFIAMKITLKFKGHRHIYIWKKDMLQCIYEKGINYQVNYHQKNIICKWMWIKKKGMKSQGNHLDRPNKVNCYHLLFCKEQKIHQCN